MGRELKGVSDSGRFGEGFDVAELVFEDEVSYSFFWGPYFSEGESLVL